MTWICAKLPTVGSVGALFCEQAGLVTVKGEIIAEKLCGEAMNGNRQGLKD